ncbi:unnamed protein product [Mytilus edulis]|uniref:Uncharacterized protein n=1 Tax=Mytilus edulis TaxID=6550 RepID=A0A8S3V1D6_MYTED|nr:unnamed protein product [Mytilus edulis]
MAQEGETISRVIENPLSNKYKQMAQERETVSKWSLEKLCQINTNKMAQERERQYQKVIENLCPINTNKWHKRRDNIKGSLKILCPINTNNEKDRDNQRRDNIKGSLEILCPINTNKWHKEREIVNPLSNTNKWHKEESIGNPLSNKYKTNGTRERETISKGHWKSFVQSLEILCTNKWHKRERQYQRVNKLEIENLCPINTNKWHKRERDNTKGHWKILCPINTNKWHKRERQYQRVIEILCPINTKQMAQERETIPKGHWKILCPINTNKCHKMGERISKGHKRGDNIGNPLSNKYKQMAQEERDNKCQRESLEILCPINTNKWHKRRETISKGH